MVENSLFADTMTYTVDRNVRSEFEKAEFYSVTVETVMKAGFDTYYVCARK